MTATAATDRLPLANSDLEVSPLCLGSNVFGWNVDESTAHAVLDAFFEGGGNFIDTADSYSAWVDGNVGGESERIIGNWMRDRGVRDQVVVATKIGSAMPCGSGLGADYVRAAVDASLARLQLDVIDVLYAHHPDPSTPIVETLRAFDQLVRAGKVRAIGLSNLDAQQLREAIDAVREHDLASISLLQNEYNLLERDAFGPELQQLCLDAGIAMAPFYSLALGFLTGKYVEGGERPDSMRAGGVLGKFGNERGWNALRLVREIADAHDATPAQVALAWLAAQSLVVTPIASATSVDQVRELLAGPTLPLTSDEIARLDAVD